MLVLGLGVSTLLTGCATRTRSPRQPDPAPIRIASTASPHAEPSSPQTPPSPAAAPSSAAPTPGAAHASAPSAVPQLAGVLVQRLSRRVTPDVFVRLKTPLTSAQLSALATATGSTTVITVAVGSVGLGAGRTLALGVSPGKFRIVTPAGTAESDPLWQSIGAGSAAVAHTVAHALRVSLGGTTKVTAQSIVGAPTTPVSTSAVLAFRVGALATTGLPGVGLIVDNRYDAALALVPGTGVVLAAPGRDPVVTAAVVRQTLGSGATATALRIPVSESGRLTWVAPAVGPVTAGFGYRQSPLISGKREFHGGIDIGAPLGAPIYAASAGTVVYAGPASGFGNEVVLQHAGGVQTVYGHMERILVTAGAPVTAGQPIALVGSEGESTGPHLHFEVHVGGAYTDPLAWLIAHGVQVEH